MERQNNKNRLLFTNEEIIGSVVRSNPAIIAIDAPLSLPKEGILRKTDQEMIARGLQAFPHASLARQNSQNVQ